MFPKNLDEDSDEGSNADSDFSGDENPVAPSGTNGNNGKKTKKGKKKAATKKNVKPAKDVGKEKSTPALSANMTGQVAKTIAEAGKPTEG